MGGFKEAITKYAVFRDRSRRKEFWGFVLVAAIIAFVLSALFGAAFTMGGRTGMAILWVAWFAALITGLALFIPYLSLSWRRFQDVGINGAWSIVGWVFPIVTVVVAFIPGKVGPNEYGPDPKDEQ